jgi:hypothetical protein
MSPGAAMELVQDDVNGFRFMHGIIDAIVTMLKPAADTSTIVGLKQGRGFVCQPEA